MLKGNLVEGTPFGRYQLLDLLGRGGMGEVWRAYDTAIDRIVALKVLPPDFANDEVFQQRFRREARAAAGLNEPHVIPIFDFGELDGRLFVTMRLIEGQDLQAQVDRGPLEPFRAVSIIEQIASALHAAHRIGLVHRDVKPSNILIGEDDFAYLIDFGIAQAAGDTKLTSTGATIGTWAYMAPERFQTGKSDARSDTYSLTCVLYQCLTGETPFAAVSIEQIAVAHLFQPPPLLSDSTHGLGTAMDDVIATGMAKDPEQRYATTKDLATAARHALTGVASPGESTSSLPTQPTVHRSAQPAPYVTRVPPPRPEPPIPAQPPPAPHDGIRPPLWKRARFLVPTVAAVFLVAALAITAVVLTEKPTEPRAAAPAPSTTAEQPGPIAGTYRVAYGPDTRLDGTPHADVEPGYAPAVEDWDILSTCPKTGCVATAARTSSGGVTQVLPALVFDEVAGRWLAVGVEPQGVCSTRATEVWGAMSLAVQPDGTLSGDFTYTSPIACGGKRTVTFTRTGAVTPDKVTDPAAETPRVASPAQAFHGQYHWVRTFVDGSAAPDTYDYAVQTECIRTAERCLSFLASSSSGTADALVFANNAWTQDISYDSTCDGGSGAVAHDVDTAEFPLPQPLQDPITLLVGHGNHGNSGACRFDHAFEERIERTSD